MKFIYDHPIISTIIVLLMANFLWMLITRSERSPFTRLLLFVFAMIGQACSPFSGTVDKEKSDSYYYSKSKKYIQFSPMGNWFELGNTRIDSADVATFEILTRNFAKDKNHIFFQEHILTEVDYETFVSEEYYCYDQYRVYKTHFHGMEGDWDRYLQVIEGADPKTYLELDHSWAKDDKNFFYRARKIDVEYNSFELINEHFAKDSQQVYLIKLDKLMNSEIDVSTFEKIDDRYALDKDYVYDFMEWEDGKEVDELKRLPYQNKADINILEYDFLTLDDKVFYNGHELPDAEVKTFSILDNVYYSSDNQNVYYLQHKISGADAKSFQVFEWHIYAKDKDFVYKKGHRMDDADAATFGPSQGKYGIEYKDKYRVYPGVDELD